MTRRNALDRLRTHAQDPISSIPLAQARKRSNRSWDRVHRGITYFVPVLLNEQAKDLRTSILALAQYSMSNTSSVAAALIAFSLNQVHQAKLVIEAHPNARGRKMALTWEEGDGQTREIPQPAKRIQKDKTKNIYLNYRWDRGVDMEIRALLAGDAISPGEVVVFLLSYALAAHESGRLRLRVQPTVTPQKRLLA